MALRSMTGFARIQGQADGASWAWELKTVNAKGFDLRLRMPSGLDAVEAETRRMIGTVVGRGRSTRRLIWFDRRALPRSGSMTSWSRRWRSA
jgi:uncharacterized protein YicC (UPF0701 family)